MAEKKHIIQNGAIIKGVTDTPTVLEVYNGSDILLTVSKNLSGLLFSVDSSTGPLINIYDDTRINIGSANNPPLSFFNNSFEYLKFNTTFSSNSTYSGIIEAGTVGENVAFGDVLYLKFSDGKWWKAKADAYTTTPAVRMALGTINANASGTLLIEGNVRYDTWNFAAAKIYLSAATAGAITSTQPSTTGNQIQVIGIAKTATTLYFKPSYDVGEK